MQTSNEKGGMKRRVNTIPISTTRMWLEEAWEGWIRSFLMIAGLAGVGAFYYFGFLGEWLAGFLVSASLVLLPLIIAGVQAAGLARSDRQALTTWGCLGLVALVGMTYVVASVFPGEPLFRGTLSSSVREMALEAPADTHRLSVMVTGHVADVGSAEYILNQELKSAVSKETVTTRTQSGKLAGGTTESDQHRFGVAVSAPPTALRVEKVDSALSHLVVEIYRAWLPTEVLLVASALLLLFALFMDSRLSSSFQQSYITIAATFVLMFGFMYHGVATPSHLVKNAIGAATMAGMTGVALGIIASAAGRRLLGGGARANS